MDITTTFTAGVIIGFGLLLAVGPQAMFILRQGLRREHIGLVCSICFLSEFALVGAGVVISTQVSEVLPMLDPIMRLAGAAFLVVYGLKAALPVMAETLMPRAVLVEGPQFDVQAPVLARRGAILGTTLAFTWLNPHVYLDTIVFVGSLSTTYDLPWVFGLGATFGAGAFYYGLGYGARIVAPFFGSAIVWKRLDLTMGLIMVAMGMAVALPMMG